MARLILLRLTRQPACRPVRAACLTLRHGPQVPANVVAPVVVVPVVARPVR
jgi:hypothetical protein